MVVAIHAESAQIGRVVVGFVAVNMVSMEKLLGFVGFQINTTIFAFPIYTFTIYS